MAYTGRILMPGTATTSSNGNWLWKDSTLYRLRRTVNEAKQLAAKQMVVQEDMDPKALPTVDLGNLHGAQKFAQIGCDAARKLLQATLEPCQNIREIWLSWSCSTEKKQVIVSIIYLLWNHSSNQDGVNFGNHTGLLIIDATPLTGNFFEGFVEITKEANTPIRYIPVFNDEGHHEWFHGFFLEDLTNKFLKNELKVPTFQRHFWGKKIPFPF